MTGTICNERGFTLIESLIAMVVLAIGILSLQAMQVTSIKGNAHANRISGAAAWATDTLEWIYAKPYRDGTLSCTNDPMCDRTLDGTGKDTNLDGIDDSGAGNEFGLNSDTTATADHNATNGVYTIYWNIAEDVPAPNNKTVRVIVVSDQQGTTRRVVYDYIKTDII